MRKILSFMLFLGTFFPVYALYPDVINYTKESYKSGSQNWSVAQQQNNWMYFANNDALLEFDGVNWAEYPIKNYTTVRSVLCSSDGRIYAGAFNEFGYYSSDEKGRLQYTSLSDSLYASGIKFNEVWNISDSEHGIFFQSGNYIFLYAGDSIRTYTFAEQIMYAQYVHNMYLVVGISSGVYSLQGSFFIKLPGSEILDKKRICGIFPMEMNRILFVTEFDGCFLFDGKETVALPLQIDHYLRTSQVFCTAKNKETLALGTVRNGLILIDLKTLKPAFLNTYSGLQNNTILSMMFDRQNNLWLGLDKGIDYVNINSNIYNLFGTNNLYGTGYASLLDEKTMYLGTNQGLFYEQYPFVQSPLPIELTSVAGISGQVWCLQKIDGQIFCGTDRGLFLVKGRQAIRISGISGTWNIKHLKKHPEYILGASYQGMFLLHKKDGIWSLLHHIKGLAETTGAFEEDTLGHIWMCHWRFGIYRLVFNSEMTAFSDIKLFNYTNGLATSENNAVCRIDDRVVISAKNGFFIYNEEEQKLELYKPLQGIYAEIGESMRAVQSPKGDIWCVSPEAIIWAHRQADSIYFVDSYSLKSLNQKLKIGFEHLNFVDNSVLISTEDGFSWVTPQRIDSIDMKFQVFIRNVYLTKTQDTLVGGNTDQQAASVLEIPYTDNSVRFEYVASEYRDQAAVRYKYKLEGYDEKWQSALSCTKEYTNLRDGKYIFRVVAENNLAGQEAETSYEFVVLPPWYRTKWAYFAYIVLLLVACVLLFVFLNNLSKRRAYTIEQKKEKELKEQKQMFEADAAEKKKEISMLKNQKLQYELKQKSQELANSTMNIIRKNEVLMEVSNNLDRVAQELKAGANNEQIEKRLGKLQDHVKQNMASDDNWKMFSENFDLVYQNFISRLSEAYPQLTVADKKLCAYLKMDLSSKDIAPLLNMTTRSVEMSRYRLRQKIGIKRDENLQHFLQNF